MSNFNILEFIKPAFDNDAQYTIIRAGRRVGKTYNAFIWILVCLFARKETKGLWVDTAQANLDKYVIRYIQVILGQEIWKLCHYDKQKHILTLPNGSILDMGSAERPELLEGFSYDFCVLNEAGIILKKDGLWDRTIKPMTKNATVKIIGTPKGKFSKYAELSRLVKNDTNWEEYVYTVYDSPEYSELEIERLKQSEPDYIWEQEYMAQFTNVDENAIIKEEYLSYYERHSEITEVSIHADTTHTGKTTSDYFSLSVIGKCKDNYYNLLDFCIEKTDVENQAKKIISYYQRYKDKKIVSLTYDAVSNDGFEFLCKKLAREQGVDLPLIGKKYKSDKISHLNEHFDKFKSGSFRLPSNHNQLDLAISQLLSFPAGKNDDFVDSVTGALDWWKATNKEESYYMPVYF
jgi:predicted phage terminase large subunit-like protein